jgi:hypothetical protein
MGTSSSTQVISSIRSTTRLSDDTALYFNASEDELILAGASPVTSVQVKDGGYIASLGVYHELHCLGRLRYTLYSTNITQTNNVLFTEHLGNSQVNAPVHCKLRPDNKIDHCLEVLRISAMCRVDLSVYTFTWSENSDAQFLDAHSSSKRGCVDFEQLEAYAARRGIGLAPTLLRPAAET